MLRNITIACIVILCLLSGIITWVSTYYLAEPELVMILPGLLLLPPAFLLWGVAARLKGLAEHAQSLEARVDYEIR